MRKTQRTRRRGQEIGLRLRLQELQAAGLLRGAGLYGAAATIERDVARRGRLSR